MAVTAYQATTSSTKMISASSVSDDAEVTIQNLGPNAIYLNFGAAATVAGGLQIPADSAYTTRVYEDVYVIAETANQSTPEDTRVSVERTHS